MLPFFPLILAWQVWLVIALLLFLLEIITPGFVLACFGAGALLAVPAALLGGSWLVQVVIFCIGSLLALKLLQPLMCRWFSFHDQKTGMDALIGRHVLLVEAIEAGSEGLVAVDGDVWRAVAPEGISLPAGCHVRITGYDSIVLRVEALPNY